MSHHAELTIEASTLEFRESVLAGLRRDGKTLSCKYFYDERGSQLFDRICELDEYYLTRTELAIMSQYAQQMGEALAPSVRLVEYGSGSSLKTRILLDHLNDPAVYVPVDISRDHLLASAESIRADFPHIEVAPVVADFTAEFRLPNPQHEVSHTAVYFPGSTIGNFEPEAAEQLLHSMAKTCGVGGGMLIGIDLVKDRAVLEAAYDDAEGVTAEFNLNLLRRMQTELDADLDLDQFSHVARYDANAQRIEIFIRSEVDQSIRLGDEEFSLAAGELIHTEYSHKYTVDGFTQIANKAGFVRRKVWSDSQQYFAVMHFVVEDSAP